MLQQTLIINAIPLTMTKETIPFEIHQILIEGSYIKAIGKNIEVSEDVIILDAKGSIVMPGMVDTHRHTWQSLLRAQLGDGTLYDYMAKLRYGFAPQFSVDDAELGNYAGALDALNSGITTIVDHSHLISTPDHANALIKGLENSGIRAVFCYGLADVTDAKKTIDAKRAFTSTWRHKDAERIRSEKFLTNDSLIRFGIGASEFLFAPLSYTVSEIQLAKKLEAHRFSIHVANGPFARGTRYVSRLLDKGLVDNRTLFVHGNVLTSEDLIRIRDTGASISVTPESEMQMGMGTPIWPLAKQIGVPCGIGADIVSGGSGDLFTQMRLALIAGRMATNNKIGKYGIMPETLTLTAEDALRAVTIEAAKVAGLDNEIGSIEIGKRADLIFIRTDSVNIAPVLDPIKTVVMQANVADIDLVMVNGRVLKSNGKILDCDQTILTSQLQKSAERIVSSVTDQHIENAYTYMKAAFPLDVGSAFATRFAGWALRMPWLDQVVFNMMLKQLNNSLKPEN